jgi:hypothetical protein
VINDENPVAGLFNGDDTRPKDSTTNPVSNEKTSTEMFTQFDPEYQQCLKELEFAVNAERPSSSNQYENTPPPSRKCRSNHIVQGANRNAKSKAKRLRRQPSPHGKLIASSAFETSREDAVIRKAKYDEERL